MSREVLSRLAAMVLAVLAVGAPVAAAPAGAAEPSVKLVDEKPVFSRERDKDGEFWRAHVIVEVANADKADHFRDPAEPTAVTVQADLTEAGRDQGSLLYPLVITARGSDLRSEPHVIAFEVTSGAAVKTMTVPYLLLNRAAADWSIREPGTLAWTTGAPIPVALLAHDGGARNLHIVPDTLKERSSGRPLDGLSLCRSKSADTCGRQIDLAPFSPPTTLWIANAGPSGHYDGEIVLTSDDWPDGKSVKASINLSTRLEKGLGVGAIALGLALAWVVSVLIRGWYARSLWLLQAARLQQRVAALQRALNSMPVVPATSHVSDRMADVDQKLSTQGLKDNGLPPLAASPLAAAGAPTRDDEFKAYLKALNDWVAALDLIVHDGLGGVAERFQDGQPAARFAALRAAADAIDRLADGQVAPTPDVIASTVQAALAALDPQVHALLAAGLGPTISPARARARVLDLEVRVAGLSGAAWLYVWIATLLVGTYSLILSPDAAGFGQWRDYVNCFTWGLGLPVAAQLAQMSAGSVATSLFPRA